MKRLFLPVGERRGLLLATAAALLALGIVGAVLRFHRLAELEPVLRIDEGAHAMDALKVLRGEHAPFFPENEGREGLIVYLVALAIAAIGPTVLAVRLPMAIASLASVFAIFWLGWLLFGRDEESGQARPWKGLLFGAVSAGLMATSVGQFYIGRMALRASLLPLFLTLSAALLWSGWNHPRRGAANGRIALAGLCLGLLAYTYSSARIAPIFYLLFGLSFLLPAALVTRGTVSETLRERWTGACRAHARRILLFGGVAGVAASPILIYFYQYPEQFSSRSIYFWRFEPDIGLLRFLSLLLDHLLHYLSLFGFRQQIGWNPNFNGEFLLLRYEAVFFWLGTGVALWRWRGHPKYRFLLLWVVVLLIPAVLSTSIGPGDRTPIPSRRAIGAAPAVYLLMSVGVWETVQFLKARAAPAYRSRTVQAAVLVVVGAIVYQGARNYQTYFVDWGGLAERHGMVGSEYMKLAAELSERQADPNSLYLLSSQADRWRFSFDYLYQGATPVELARTDIAGFDRQVDRIMAEHASAKTVHIVAWNTNNGWIGDDDEALEYLFNKYGRRVERERFADYRIHTYSDLSREEPWTFYDQIEPREIRYDGGIELKGFALGQGKEQLRMERDCLNCSSGVAWDGEDSEEGWIAAVGTDRSLWGFLQWRIGAALEVDYAFSLRLYDVNGELAYQADNTIRNFVLLTPTSSWAANEISDTLFYLDLPPELASGEYELRLVVYDFETQVPTVETGVWQVESTLARLRLSPPAGAGLNTHDSDWWKLAGLRPLPPRIHREGAADYHCARRIPDLG